MNMKTMKQLLLALGVLAAGLISGEIKAQSVDEQIISARNHWRAGDYVGAKSELVAIVANHPIHEEANALLGILRLLALVEEPGVAALLDRYQVETEGRDALDWSASYPEGSDGFPVVPEGASSQEIVDRLRSEVVPELALIAGHWERVQSPEFLLTLSPEETRMDGVTLDRADLALSRAMVDVLAWFLLTLHAWNLDAELEWLVHWREDDGVSVESLLDRYPALLEVSGQGDLRESRLRLLQAIGSYLTASEWLRERDPEAVRLFNVDDDDLETEAEFRDTVISVKEVLESRGRYTFEDGTILYPDVHFSGEFDMRRSLPRFHQDRVIEGSFDEPSFGGLVEGLTGEELNIGFPRVFSDKIMVPEIHVRNGNSVGSLDIVVSAIPGRTYVLTSSRGLDFWDSVETATAQSQQLIFSVDVDLEERDLYFRIERESSAPHSWEGAPYELFGNSGRHIDYFSDEGFFESTLWFRWVAIDDNSMSLRVDRGASAAIPRVYRVLEDGTTERIRGWDFEARAEVWTPIAGEQYLWKVTSYESRPLLIEWGTDLPPLEP